MPVPGSKQVCSELFSPVVPQDVHLPPIRSAASRHLSPFPLGRSHFLPSAALLGSLPFTFTPGALLSLLTVAVTASLNPAPALWSTAGVARHGTAVCNAAAASLLLLSWDLTNLLLGEAHRPGNSFWQLVSCLQSVHQCHG